MIKIICVGKIKEDFIEKGINEYLKRLSAFTKVTIIELKEGNNIYISKTIESEGRSILDKINKDDFVITLEIAGKMLDSIELSKKNK